MVRRWPNCSDYVIKDGKLVGEFEKMYQDFDEPWDQIEIGQRATFMTIGIHLLRRVREATGASRVVELGCGLGHYAKRISELGYEVLGLDISETAIGKAKENFEEVKFRFR